jgi:hypothetical protein
MRFDLLNILHSFAHIKATGIMHLKINFTQITAELWGLEDA